MKNKITEKKFEKSKINQITNIPETVNAFEFGLKCPKGPPESPEHASYLFGILNWQPVKKTSTKRNNTFHFLHKVRFVYQKRTQNLHKMWNLPQALGLSSEFGTQSLNSLLSFPNLFFIIWGLEKRSKIFKKKKKKPATQRFNPVGNSESSKAAGRT